MIVGARKSNSQSTLGVGKPRAAQWIGGDQIIGNGQIRSRSVLVQIEHLPVERTARGSCAKLRLDIRHGSRFEFWRRNLQKHESGNQQTQSFGIEEKEQIV